MRNFYIILIVIAVAIIVGAAYFFKVNFAGHQPVEEKEVKDVLTVEKFADSIRRNTANLDELFNKYKDSDGKVVSLQGNVTRTDTSGGMLSNIYFEDGDVEMQCTMEQDKYKAAEAPASGKEIAIKGYMVGVDDFLGLQVKLGRCIIER